MNQLGYLSDEDVLRRNMATRQVKAQNVVESRGWRIEMSDSQPSSWYIFAEQAANPSDRAHGYAVAHRSAVGRLR